MSTSLVFRLATFAGRLGTNCFASENTPRNVRPQEALMRVLRLVGTVALWIVNILAAAAFVAIGLAKFGSPEWAIKFERWGYPDGFYMVIGALELAGGVLLLVPRVSSYAAALLGAILLGAAATHAFHAEAARVAPPLMWLAVTTLIGVARRRRAWRPAIPTASVPPGRRNLSAGGANQV
jgi:putative oxidoreductase